MSGRPGCHRAACPRAGAVAAAIAALLVCAPARAVDPFEIQVYDAGSAAPGQVGLEVHINSVIQGNGKPSRPSCRCITGRTSPPKARSESPAGAEVEARRAEHRRRRGPDRRVQPVRRKMIVGYLAR
jgi:hypothetical protein